MHPAGKLHNKLQHALIRRLRRLTPDKCHIQLQDIDRHLIQHIQGRIAASEIVHFDDKAQFPQMADRLDDLSRILRVGAFRNLKMEPGRRQAVFTDDAHHNIRDIRVINIRPGYVHGDRHGRVALIVPPAQITAGFIPHKLIQFCDESVLFKQWNKFRRRLESPFRMLPAHQRLGSGHGLITDPVFRLQID